jgi:hypothetical protein
MTSWLGRLFEPDQLIEIRAIDAVDPETGRKSRCLARRFMGDNLEQIAEEALDLTRRSSSVYFVMNQLHLGLRHASSWKAAEARHVIRRRLLLIDCDTVGPRDGMATDAEKDAALALARRTREFLDGRGWPEPLFADSGNGYHLLYRIDLPRDDGGLVRGALLALGRRLDAPGAAIIDPVVHDPVRLSRVYGTLNAKWNATPDRPHRRSAVLSLPPALEVVSKRQLERLGADCPAQPEARARSSARAEVGRAYADDRYDHPSRPTHP